MALEGPDSPPSRAANSSCRQSDESRSVSPCRMCGARAHHAAPAATRRAQWRSFHNVFGIGLFFMTNRPRTAHLAHLHMAFTTTAHAACSIAASNSLWAGAADRRRAACRRSPSPYTSSTTTPAAAAAGRSVARGSAGTKRGTRARCPWRRRSPHPRSATRGCCTWGRSDRTCC